MAGSLCQSRLECTHLDDMGQDLGKLRRHAILMDRFHGEQFVILFTAGISKYWPIPRITYFPAADSGGERKCLSKSGAPLPNADLRADWLSVARRPRGLDSVMNFDVLPGPWSWNRDPSVQIVQT